VVVENDEMIYLNEIYLFHFFHHFFFFHRYGLVTNLHLSSTKNKTSSFSEISHVSFQPSTSSCHQNNDQNEEIEIFASHFVLCCGSFSSFLINPLFNSSSNDEISNSTIELFHEDLKNFKFCNFVVKREEKER